jgi:hypothetical protein
MEKTRNIPKDLHIAVTACHGESNGMGQNMDKHSVFELEEVATTVEERFRRAYHQVGNSESYEEVSLGWWLVLKRMGLSLWIGKEKPGIASGDLLKIKISKKELPTADTGKGVVSGL